MKVFSLLMKKTLSFIAILFTVELYSAVFPAYRTDTIRIGLLISDNQSVAAKHGAMMAINEENKRNSGNILVLEVRSMDGPWGIGGKQTVDLVFNKDVLALVSAVDGRNAHLAEQVSAKSHVVFINAGSGDPTLSRAFVPWYFSCLPDERQIAFDFVAHLSSNRSQKIIALIDSSYDARISADSFSRACKAHENIEFKTVNYSGPGIGNMINEIRKTDSECIIIFGKKQAALMLIDKLHREVIRQPIYVRIILPEEKEFSKEDLAMLEGCYLLTYGFVPENSGFARIFSALYGYKPGAAAAYAYDAVNLLIAEAKQAYFDRLKLFETISASDFKGVMGEISFDKRGNLRWTGEILRISNGKLVSVEK